MRHRILSFAFLALALTACGRKAADTFEEVRDGAAPAASAPAPKTAPAAASGELWKMTLDEETLKSCAKAGDGVWNGAVVRINGQNEARRWERVVLPLPEPAGKKIRVSAEVKAQISKGKFQLALRSADADDVTIAYDGPFVLKSQDWTPVSQVVKLSNETTFTMIYFLALDLDDKSVVEVRNVKFEEVR